MRRIANAAILADVLPSGASLAQEGDTFPMDSVETHIGELTFDHGLPTEETSEKLLQTERRERRQTSWRGRSKTTSIDGRTRDA